MNRRAFLKGIVVGLGVLAAGPAAAAGLGAPAGFVGGFARAAAGGDVVYQITPLESPFCAVSGSAPLHEWFCDSLTPRLEEQIESRLEAMLEDTRR